jgi:hypothetical protein
MKRLAFLLCAASLAMSAPDVRAVTKLEGEYQLQLDLRKQDRIYKWDFDSNNNDTFGLTQFRLFSSPVANSEAFVKVEAEWNSGGNGDRRPQFQYREAHVRFRWPAPGEVTGAEVYLFSRQDRFWVENHLIEVVRPGSLTDNGNGQGVRFNVWGPNGFAFNAIASDFSGQSNPSSGAQVGAPTATDDAYVLRLRREFLGRKLRTGVTYNRKVESQPGERAFTEVFAGDLRLALGTTDVLIEYAESHNKRVAGFRDGQWNLDRFRLSDTKAWMPSDAVLRAEVRAITIGLPKLGFFSVAPSYWFLGPDYNNQLGGGNNDEEGYYINSWYLLPERAITLTANYLNYVREVNDKKKITEFYGEIYTEYVYGFRSKFFYRDRVTRDFNNAEYTEITKNRDFFTEVQVENRLAWLRIQAKLKDLWTPLKKTITSMETSINLTERMKVYNRFTFANDPTRLRRGLFSELQYRPGPNVEMFLSYGPYWIGTGNNPVDDSNLAGSADNRDLIRLILKGVF